MFPCTVPLFLSVLPPSVTSPSLRSCPRLSSVCAVISARPWLISEPAEVSVPPVVAVSVPWLSRDPPCVQSLARMSAPFPCSVPCVVSWPVSSVSMPPERVREAAPVVSVVPVSARPFVPCISPPLFISRAVRDSVPPVMRPGFARVSAVKAVAPPLCSSPVFVNAPLSVPLSPVCPFTVPLLVRVVPVMPSVAPCSVPAFVSCPPASVKPPPESHLPFSSLIKRSAVALTALLPCIRPLLRSSVPPAVSVLPATVPLLVSVVALSAASSVATMFPVLVRALLRPKSRLCA